MRALLLGMFFCMTSSALAQEKSKETIHNVADLQWLVSKANKIADRRKEIHTWYWDKAGKRQKEISVRDNLEIPCGLEVWRDERPEYKDPPERVSFQNTRILILAPQLVMLKGWMRFYENVDEHTLEISGMFMLGMTTDGEGMLGDKPYANINSPQVRQSLEQEETNHKRFYRHLDTIITTCAKEWRERLAKRKE